MRQLFGCLILALFSVTTTVHAGGINVAPVRLTFAPEQTTESFVVSNTSKRTVLIQSRAFRWQQSDGKNLYTKTQDFILAPPIVKIKPGQMQIFRVALRDPKAHEAEQAYRIYIREVIKQDANLKPQEGELKFALNIGIPVFVKPRDYMPPSLSGRLQKNAKGQWQVALKNPGNQHIQVLSVEVQKNKQALHKAELVKYVLPGKVATLALPKLTTVDAKNSKIILMTDAGRLTLNDA